MILAWCTTVSYNRQLRILKLIFFRREQLYLIPVTMGESDPMDVLPQTVKRTIELIDHYIVENEKTARKFIKLVNPEKPQPSLKITTVKIICFIPTLILKQETRTLVSLQTIQHFPFTFLKLMKKPET